MGKLRLRVCPDTKREKAGLRPLGTCQNPSPAHLQFLGHPCSWSTPSLRAEGPPLACTWTLRPVSSPLAQGWAEHHTQEAFRGQGGHLAQTRKVPVYQLPPFSLLLPAGGLRPAGPWAKDSTLAGTILP